ncbi:NAD(P)-dependent alcohol dehydrogenase [Komagataeibacter medellinensis]|uniref:NAD(P)-dependent alcohol dehydrogenase n=1 Tax=Komagataeibacter medellinensis TaxID=1177712 RepID=A0ABQ6VR23_9PROT|nr:NAD(P)-dependent alcohol dehydrogenase [Komagataeibacter medellinensis]KAB8122388.1 NAD(P)-dependent alcohol dehydrogenase [Komagataeibacter medellinensis]
MLSCVGYAATAADAPLKPFTFERRETGPDDVRIEILYCGVCHSDLHQARNEWHNTIYPCIPGHEIVGRIAETGTSVTRFKKGDMVGVGCLVDSCRECASCREGLEQYCEIGFVATYNGEDRHGRGITFGGYSRAVVVDQSFVLRVPDTLDPAAASPLLCAGITTWSPLRKWKVGPGQRVGIVGLGGLGHMGVKFARALGAEVVLFTTSPGKIADGLRLGAHEVVLSKDADAMAKERGQFDFILDAVAADHDINAYLDLLKRDGTMVQVGAPEKPLPVSVFSLLMKRRSFAGSLIGGIPETQEMLDFCGKHNITADIEMIRMDEIETAYTRMLRSDVKYRFVIDMATMPQSA